MATAGEMSVSQSSLTTITRETSSQPRRTARPSVVPSRFASKDVFTGKEFLAATASQGFSSKSKEEATKPRSETANAPRNVHFDGNEEDEEDQPQTPGKTARALLQQFGGRKTKIPNNATK
jgi:hypothetical protein